AMTAKAAELTVLEIAFHDALVLTDLGISIPEGATVRGIAFEVRRNADAGSAADDTIQVVRNGSPVGVNHAKDGAWPMTLTYTTYGGPTDTWGVSWLPADFRSSGFGISIAPRYTGPSAGKDPAPIDSGRGDIVYVPPW